MWEIDGKSENCVDDDERGKLEHSEYSGGRGEIAGTGERREWKDRREWRDNQEGQHRHEGGQRNRYRQRKPDYIDRKSKIP